MNTLAKLAIAAGAVVMLFGAEQYVESLGADKANLLCATKIDGVALEAGQKLKEATAKEMSYKNAVQAFVNTINGRDHDHEKTVTVLSGRLRDLADSGGRLRDPNFQGCGSGGVGAEGRSGGDSIGGAAGRSEANGLLSKQLSELLQERLREADEVNNAYDSCKPLLIKLSEKRD